MEKFCMVRSMLARFLLLGFPSLHGFYAKRLEKNETYLVYTGTDTINSL